MFGTTTFRSSRARGASRVAVGAVLALWCLFALATGDARALCLDFGGACSPAAAAPGGPCHDQGPDGGANSSCAACFDILVHEDAAARGSRPDDGLQAPAAAPAFGSAADAPLFAGEPRAAAAALAGTLPPHPSVRTAVLRI
jgi:hypothetical protein